MKLKPILNLFSLIIFCFTYLTHLNAQIWTNYTTKNGLANNNAKTYVVDNNGTLWIGALVGRGGLTKFDGTTWTEITKKNGFPKFKLKELDVNHLFKDKNGDIYCSFFPRGVSKYTDSTWTPTGNIPELQKSLVLSSALDKDGTLWLGTSRHGIFSYDGKDWKNYKLKHGFSSLYRNLIVNAIAVDAQNNKWFGTTNGGASKFDGKTWTRYNKKNGLRKDINVIAVDKIGTIWFGTLEYGVIAFDGKSWTSYTKKDGLASNQVKAIAIDEMDVKWFGCFNGGLSKLDKEGVTNFKKSNDFDSKNVEFIYVDPKTNTKWIGTLRNGLFKLVDTPISNKTDSLISISGNLTDAETKLPINGKIVLIKKPSNDTIIKQGANNTYMVDILPGVKYDLLGGANGYTPINKELFYPTSEIEKTFSANFTLTVRMRKVIFEVSDKENKKGLKVKIKLTNLATNEEQIIEVEAGRDGKYAISLKEGNKYNVEVNSIEGYAFSNTIIEVPVTEFGSITASTSSSNQNLTNSEVFNFNIQLQPLKENSRLTLNNIHFQFNKTQLEEESYQELGRVVELLKLNPTLKIEIAAHTDDIGSDEFNNNLSAKRAQEIVAYLNSKGVDTNRLVAKGYGKSKPLDTANTEEARAKNRRVELKILDGSK